ncbi:MAG: 4Fe-4S binding protein [Methanobacterium sp.]|uniref:tungsten-dependent formylmethanofuran dehydrogenase subunit FwdF n=1 Tax=Methanobacterium sp. TaxID=2164 RepID=UPI003D651F9C|nr:4Fe-4S binding protein [Methanobacterium sp.]
MTSVERNGNQKRSLAHKNEKCVGCGICTDICPTESIKLGPVLPIARGIVKMDYINLDNAKCVLCGLCASTCPFNALEFKIDDKNIKELEAYPKWEHEAKIDEESCIYCGHCVKVCPKDAIFLQKVMPERSEFVIGETDINEDKCIYCGMCKDICPAEAIKIEPNDINSSNPEIAKGIRIDESKCVYCGLCRRICPEDAIKIICTTCMYRDEIEEPEIIGDILLNEDQCINCGWCQKICPKDAAVVTKPFEGHIYMDENVECKGDSCHACLDVCPCNAVSIVDTKSSVNPDLCVLCGACKKACPQKCIVIKRDKMNLNNIRSKSWKTRIGQLMEDIS